MLFDFLVEKQHKNLSLILKPLGSMVFLLKGGVYMQKHRGSLLFSSKVGGYILIMYILSSYPVREPIKDMIFYGITVFIVFCLIFIVPWEKIDAYGI